MATSKVVSSVNIVDQTSTSKIKITSFTATLSNGNIVLNYSVDSQIGVTYNRLLRGDGVTTVFPSSGYYYTTSLNTNGAGQSTPTPITTTTNNSYSDLGGTGALQTLSSISYPASVPGLNIGGTLTATGITSTKPLAGTSYSYVLEITGSTLNLQAYAGLVINVPTLPNIAGATVNLPAATQGLAYNGAYIHVSDSDGLLSGTNTYAIVGNLPPGLSLNSSTGAITGTVSSTASIATYGFGISVTGPAGTSTSSGSAYSITVGASVTLAYNSNGGSPTPTGGTYAQSSIVTVSSTIPVLSGNIFKGWLNSYDGLIYTGGNTFSITSSTTLIAQWQTTTITPTFTNIGTITTTGKLGVSYSSTTATTNATTLNAVTGLPPGLVVSLSNNVITLSGTPTSQGSYSFSFTILSSTSTSATSSNITLSIGPAGKQANGTTLTSAKRFDGTNWIGLTNMKKFDGTTWQNISN